MLSKIRTVVIGIWHARTVGHANRPRKDQRLTFKTKMAAQKYSNRRPIRNTLQKRKKCPATIKRSHQRGVPRQRKPPAAARNTAMTTVSASEKRKPQVRRGLRGSDMEFNQFGWL